MNLALAIHTTTPQLGLALSDFAEESRHQVWNLGRSLSSHLHLHLNEFIQPYQWSDLAFLAVAKGPGGFTGTRIGVVTARTLAQQLTIPLFPISTLAAIAWSTVLQKTGVEMRSLNQSNSKNIDDIAVQMPAQRGELFTAIYSLDFVSLGTYLTPGSVSTIAQLTALLPDTVMSPDAWQHTLETWHRPYYRVMAEGDLGSSTLSLLELAYLEWQQGARPDWTAALPFYGQSHV